MRWCKDHLPKVTLVADKKEATIRLVEQTVSEAFVSEGCSVCGLKTKILYETVN